ncbi:hypothetical protein FH972_023009 [Carpinus fangiana]|uniref:Uncharacterized protein n=1 Tax=Carpinus fangiana TaxID=176857 RepID=A0A5N6KUE5_9ROSI|nr:hypothetical protein FH972_023009 [Carpinus fangiana]
MAMRQCMRRAGASLRPCTPIRSLATSRGRGAAAATATAVQGSNLPQEVIESIQRDTTLCNPDPHPDSKTAGLVTDQLQYMVPTYVRPMPMFEKGEGCYLWDVENRQYLDFTAGIAVNALGHCDPGVTQTIQNQAAQLMHTSNLYHNPWTGLLSKELVSRTKQSGAMQDAARAFICNSGSEANEAAIKFARKAGRTLDPSGEKHRILSFHQSFHGRTLGALSATPNPKYQKPFAPMLPGFHYGTFNDIAALDTLITDKTCGVIVEPIQGEGGVNVATEEFLLALRRRCNETGALLIFDEIQCGLGRTGSLWAHGDHPSEAHPDILTTAKALGNGFPVGATLVSEKVSSMIQTGDHGTTFGGNPLGARVAHHIIGRLSDPQLQQSVRQKEQVFRQCFGRLQQRFPQQIGETRGKGLMLGLQLHDDPAPIITAARERGLLIITCGTNTLRFVPPLIITQAEIEKGMAILEDAMTAVFATNEHVPPTRGQQEMGGGSA